MKGFEAYLSAERHLSQSSIGTYSFLLGKFSKWLMREGLAVESLIYRDLLRFVKERRQLKEKKRYINQSLTVIRHYYCFLIHKGITDYNPAVNLLVRGVVRRLPHGLLERERLDELYQRYEGSLRHQALLGLLVFQALSVTELQHLETVHVDLARGLVHVPETSRCNSRMLPLEACQVLQLRDYLALVSGTPMLFSSGRGSGKLTNVLARLMSELRQINPKVRNATHLRMSVISDWLISRDVRVVQQKAGHRHVSSTQRYQQDMLRALQQDMENFHPLG